MYFITVNKYRFCVSVIGYINMRGNEIGIGYKTQYRLITSADSFKEICNDQSMVMTHAVEIILTLSANLKGSADQQSIDAQTEISLSLDMTTCLLKYPLFSLKDRCK